jgi:NADH:ubiquinone oxidoreductase subunit 5 (subunit L)/multisubunit Na+/H+ antiporter MnhA subunit
MSSSSSAWLAWLFLLPVLAALAVAALPVRGARVAVAVGAVVAVVVGGVDVVVAIADRGSWQYLANQAYTGARLVADLAPQVLRPFVPLVLEPLTTPLLVVVVVVGAAGVLGLAADHAYDRANGRSVAVGLLLWAGALLVVLAARPGHLIAAFALVGAVGAAAPTLAGGGGDGMLKALGVQRVGDVGLIVAMLALGASFGGEVSFESLLAAPPALEPWDRVAAGAFAGVAHRTLWFAAAIGVAVAVGSRTGLASWFLLRDVTADPRVPAPLLGLVHALAFHGAGLILLLRLYPILALAPEAQLGLQWAAVATAIVCGALALAGRDLLRLDAHILAGFCSIAVVGVSAGDSSGGGLAVVVVVSAALGLPWALAHVVAATGERDPVALRGLEGALPRAHSTRLLLTAAVAALPPFAGFVVVERALEVSALSTAVPAGVVGGVVVGVLVVGLAAWRVLHLVFSGSREAVVAGAVAGDAAPVAPASAVAPPLATVLPAMLVAFVAPAATVLALPVPLLRLLPLQIDYDPVLPRFVGPSVAEMAAVRGLFAAPQAAPPLSPQEFVLAVLALCAAPYLLSLLFFRRRGNALPPLQGVRGLLARPAAQLARLAGQDSRVARSLQEGVERLSRLLAVNLVPVVLSLVLQRLPQGVGAVVAWALRRTQNGASQLAFFFALLVVAALRWWQP